MRSVLRKGLSQAERGYDKDVSIPMNGEGRMSQAVALGMSLWVSEMCKWIEWKWINDNAARLWWMSSDRERRPYKLALSWMELRVNWRTKSPGRTLQNLRSFRLWRIQLIVPIWHPTGSAPIPSCVILDPWGGGTDVSLTLSKWWAIWDQKHSPIGTLMWKCLLNINVRVFVDPSE